MKRRYAAAAAAFLFLTFCTLEFAGNLELLLNHGMRHLTPAPYTLLRSMTARGFLLWALLDGLGCLGIWWGLYGQSYLDYHSRMYEVVPGFEIPMPEGQGQYGTAWWLEKRDYGKVFDSIDTSQPVPLPAELERKYEEERRQIHDGAV